VFSSASFARESTQGLTLAAPNIPEAAVVYELGGTGIALQPVASTVQVFEASMHLAQPAEPAVNNISVFQATAGVYLITDSFGAATVVNDVDIERYGLGTPHSGVVSVTPHVAGGLVSSHTYGATTTRHPS
jgi:hypothetical protein